jgi:hypothetical protein
VLVGNHIHSGVLEALAYAKSLQPHYLHAVHVSFEDAQAEQMRHTWDEYDFGVPLDVIPSPYRALTRPILDFVDELDRRWKHDIVTVIVPEFVVQHWWDQILHNQSALFLKGRLLFRKGTVVTSVPSHLE